MNFVSCIVHRTGVKITFELDQQSPRGVFDRLCKYIFKAIDGKFEQLETHCLDNGVFNRQLFVHRKIDAIQSISNLGFNINTRTTRGRIVFLLRNVTMECH